ncbi:MAG: nuclease-related domain-containing protein [Ilumatobacter sp.]
MRWILPDTIEDFFVGAFVASFGWSTYIHVMDNAGLTHKRIGIGAEEQTAEVLRKRARQHSWTVVNHVMLFKRDIDHVLVTPAGIVAVETKFRSTWPPNDDHRASIVRSARSTAHDLALRLDVTEQLVKAVVVVWGPDLDDHAEIEQHGAIVVCPGPRLGEFLDRPRPDRVADDQVSAVVKDLDQYVAGRDEYERLRHGATPRSLGEAWNDLILVVAAFVATTWSVTSVADIGPPLMASIAVATLIAAASALIRRRHFDRPRVRHVSLAALSTAGCFAVLFTVARAVTLVTHIR